MNKQNKSKEKTDKNTEAYTRCGVLRRSMGKKVEYEVIGKIKM